MNKGLLITRVIVLAVVLCSCEDKGQELQKEVVHDKQEQKLFLQLNLEKGFSAVLLKTRESVGTTLKQGQETTARLKSIAEYELRCVDVDEKGIMSIEQTLRALKLEQSGPEGKWQYDSRQEGTLVPAGLRQTAAYLGNTLRMRVRPDGKGVSIEGLDPVIEKWFEEIPRPNEAEVMEQRIKARKAEIINNFRLNAHSIMEGLLEKYPSEQVKVAEKWSMEEKSQQADWGQGRTSWCLAAIKDGTAEITIERQRKLGSEKPVIMEDENIRATIKGDGKGTGRIKVDVARGFIKTIVSEGESWSDMTIEYKKEPPQIETIKKTTKSQSRMEWLAD